MDSKFSPEKEFPEPVYQEHEVRAACFNPPNYARSSTSGQAPQVGTIQPQPQSMPLFGFQHPPQSTQPVVLPHQLPISFIALQPQSTSSVAFQPQPSISTQSPPPQPHYDQWILSNNATAPPQAVHAGYDIDGELIYVGRVFHNGDFIPAKAFPIHQTACVPYQGRELVVRNFEYLVGDRYIWLPGQPFPSGAVCVNPLSQQERLYVGRSVYGGSQLCGKFVRSQNCLYVPFGTREVAITENYEILVHANRRQ